MPPTPPRSPSSSRNLRLIGSLLLYQFKKKKSLKPRICPRGQRGELPSTEPRSRATHLRGAPSPRGAGGGPGRRPLRCAPQTAQQRQGGWAGCSSLPVYSAVRVTEILPTPASCGLGAQPEGQRRRDKLLPSRCWSPCGPRPAQRAGCPGRGVPGTRGPGSRRSAPPSPQTLAMPAQPARRRRPPPRWRTTVRGTGKQTVRWGPPSCARPRERPGRRRAHRYAAGTRGGGGRPADGLARGRPVPAPSPAARAPGPRGTELGRTPELWVGTHLRPRLCSEAAGARGAGGLL